MQPLARDYHNLWHPFTQFDEWIEQENLVIDHAEGSFLYDDRGNAYLDGVSSLWCNVHGHRHPRIDDAVRAQLERVAHSTLLGLTHAPAIDLAERLANMTGLQRAFFSDSGSTAVEVALKMAFQACQQRGESKRTRFAAFTEAYHGDTIGSVSVGGIDLFHTVYRPMLFDAVRIPAPERADATEEAACMTRAAELFARHGDTLCAFVFEPLVQGAAGMRMHSPAFLAEVCAMARRAGAYLIADEVAVGFGRTGEMFAAKDRDFLCLGKGITGGYLPLAVTMTTEAVHDAFRGPYMDFRTFFHGHTYTGNPLACAAAIASLDVFDEEQTLAHLPEKVAAMGAAMAGIHHPWVSERRQCGMMGAIVLRHEKPAAHRVGHRVALAARKHGAIVRNLGDAIVLMPPLSMSAAHIRAVVGAIAHAIDDIANAEQ